MKKIKPTDLDINIGVRGRYKLAVMKDGELQRETGWFSNLITNQGLNFITTLPNYAQFCQVGSGSTTPAFTDVALAARIAGQAQSASPSISVDTTNRYLTHRYSYTFASGSAAGNISELGVGTASSGTVLFSRALVLDSFGNPTTITVLSDEDLVVVYEILFKQPTGDFSATASGRTFTIRLAYANGVSAGRAGLQQFIISTNTNILIAWTGAIGSITGSPTGTEGYAIATAMDAYTPGSYTRTGRITFPTTSANFAILSFSWVFGPYNWQAQMDTAIAKNNTQTFRLGVRLTWSRDSGPTP